MDGAQVGVLEEADQVGLGCLLKSGNSRALEAQICLEVLSDLAHQPLEWKLPDEQLGGLLVATDLTQSNSARPVAVRLLDSASGGGTLSGSLGGELLPGGLASSGLAGGLLGTSHCSESGRSESRFSSSEVFAVARARCTLNADVYFYTLCEPQCVNRP